MLWLFSANLSTTWSRVLPAMPSGGCTVNNLNQMHKIISLVPRPLPVFQCYVQKNKYIEKLGVAWGRGYKITSSLLTVIILLYLLYKSSIDA